MTRLNRHVGTSALCAAILGLTAACGGADTDADTLAADTGMVAGDTMAAGAGDMSDAAILAQMSVANGAEIAAGTMAAEKASDAQVREFAQRMVDEHQAMQAQADSLVTRAGITPQPAQPDTLQQRLDQGRERLQGQAAGAEFDRLYMDMQVTDHEGTLALLNQSRAAARNADLRALIDAAIPRVQQHLDQARQIRTALGGA